MKIQSAEAFIELCESDDPHVSRLASTGEADEAVWWDLLERFPERKEAMVFNKTIPMGILDRLSTDESVRIRVFVADKRKLSRELFERLSQDPEERVRASIAGNPKVPLDVLEGLLDDPVDWVREKAGTKLAERRRG